jgi:hypothetical protein
LVVIESKLHKVVAADVVLVVRTSEPPSCLAWRRVP